MAGQVRGHGGLPDQGEVRAADRTVDDDLFVRCQQFLTAGQGYQWQGSVPCSPSWIRRQSSGQHLDLVPGGKQVVFGGNAELL